MIEPPIDTFVSFDHQMGLIRSSTNVKTHEQILRLKWLKMSRDFVKMQGMQLILAYFKATHVSEQKYAMMKQWRSWSSLLVNSFNRKFFQTQKQKALLVRVAIAVENVKQDPIFLIPDYRFLLTNINADAIPIHDLSSCAADPPPQEAKPKKDDKQRVTTPIHLITPKKEFKEEATIQSPTLELPEKAKISENNDLMTPKKGSNSNNSNSNINNNTSNYNSNSNKIVDNKTEFVQAPAKLPTPKKSPKQQQSNQAPIQNAEQTPKQNSKQSPKTTPKQTPIQTPTKSQPSSGKKSHKKDNNNSENENCNKIVENSPNKKANLSNKQENEESVTLARDVKIEAAEDEQQSSSFLSDQKFKRIKLIAIIVTVIILFTAFYVAHCFNSLQRQLKIHDDLLKAQLQSQNTQQNPGESPIQ